jgi:hypothetical protein
MLVKVVAVNGVWSSVISNVKLGPSPNVLTHTVQRQPVSISAQVVSDADAAGANHATISSTANMALLKTNKGAADIT